jgi:hypothetical protein
MSKHETALALIDEQIEKEQKSLNVAEVNVGTAEKQLDRAEKERDLIKWSLGELRKSRDALMFDQAANSISPEPSEVP